MKTLFFLICILSTATTFSQQGFQLVAKDNRSLARFSVNDPVKITYTTGPEEDFFRGRIAAINKDEIVLRHYAKRDTTRLHLGLDNIVGIKKINRTGRVITGLIFCAVAVAGIVEMFSSEPSHQVTTPGLFGGTMTYQAVGRDGVGIGIGMMIAGSIPYLITSGVGKNLTKDHGYVFSIVKQ